jgi:hypothetical protein
VTLPAEVIKRRHIRWKGTTVHLSSREWVLAVGMAALARKSVSQLIVDLLVAELMDFELKHPGVLTEEARKVLDKEY